MDLQTTSTRNETLDRCNQAFFEGLPLTALERYELAGEIAASIEQTDLTAPQEGLRLFTGERIHTRQAANAILFEEGARALMLIDSPNRRRGHGDGCGSPLPDRQVLYRRLY